MNGSQRLYVIYSWHIISIMCLFSMIGFVSYLFSLSLDVCSLTLWIPLLGWSRTRSNQTEENAGAYGSTRRCKYNLVYLNICATKRGWLLGAFVLTSLLYIDKQGGARGQQNPEQQKANDDAKRLGFKSIWVLLLFLLFR